MLLSMVALRKKNAGASASVMPIDNNLVFCKKIGVDKNQLQQKKK